MSVPPTRLRRAGRGRGDDSRRPFILPAGSSTTIYSHFLLEGDPTAAALPFVTEPSTAQMQ
jgi:hypothetical protein